MPVNDITDMTSFKWATVTAVPPTALAIKLDGDTVALALVPDSLVDPTQLLVGDRVRVELSVRKCIIHGKANEGAIPGEVKMMAVVTGPSAPAGWLLCQGQSLLRTDYPRLFAVIGTTYGTADSTHFTLPNFQGRVPVGRDSGQTEFATTGQVGGSKTNTHNHWTGFSQDGSGFFGSTTPNLPRTRTKTATRGQIVAAAASGTTREDSTYDETISVLAPYIVVNYIIKY